MTFTGEQGRGCTTRTPEPLTQDQQLEPAMSRLIIDRTDDATTITAVQDDGTEQVVATVTPTGGRTLSGYPEWVVDGLGHDRGRWRSEADALGGIDLTETIPVQSERDGDHECWS